LDVTVSIRIVLSAYAKRKKRICLTHTTHFTYLAVLMDRYLAGCLPPKNTHFIHFAMPDTMTDGNPYNPPVDNTICKEPAIASRFAVVVIHFTLLFALLIGGPMLSRFISSSPGTSILETDLTGLDDFFRSLRNYSFVPFMLMIILDIPVYVAIRVLKGRPTRWRWLAWTTALLPIVVAFYWLVLWPPLRIPIDV